MSMIYDDLLKEINEAMSNRFNEGRSMHDLLTEAAAAIRKLRSALRQAHDDIAELEHELEKQ